MGHAVQLCINMCIDMSMDTVQVQVEGGKMLKNPAPEQCVAAELNMCVDTCTDTDADLCVDIQKCV